MDKHLRTIVGGRSTAYEGRKDFPRGIEILLKKAKVDPAFQDLLLQDPVAAAESIELTLQENEKRILVNTPEAVLKSTIKKTFVPKQHIRTFLNQKAPAMLALVLATTVILSASGGSEGITADDMIAYEMEEATDKMAVLQSALEQYKTDHGQYPSNEQWLEATNPLERYVGTNYLFDPWKRKFHYEGVQGKSGKVTNYYLESLGLDPDDPEDNIPCPIVTDAHRFPLN
ncbi:MAG: type II secretion system protein GspG [Spirochaetaceae bacterium]|nr:MAG: type II secretion system protein GspG [Spirochaetaceae bacterium]